MLFLRSIRRSGENLEDVFEITKMLGAGAFGEVYLAIHRDTRFEVAIKMIEVENVEVGEEIRKEIQILMYRTCNI